jgi:DNA repair exonuclease SbcCD nuclease subunit
MSKILYVGDPHVQVKNLKDSEALIDYVIQTAKEQDVDQVTFLGDLFHTHAVLRVEVIDFWQRAFDRMLLEGINVVVLVGNHDQPGSKEKEQEMNALLAVRPRTYSSPDGHAGYFIVVHEPTEIMGIVYIPYMSDHEAFLDHSRVFYKRGFTGCLVAHQTFTGAQYENGFFSEEGIDPALVSQQEIISGHIHKCQQVGKCFYPGTPKWDTMSDANQSKGLYVITHAEDGTTRDKKWFSTEDIVTPIKSYEINEGDELPEINSKARNYVVLKGKSAWIKKIKKQFEGCHIKVIPTDRATKVVDKNLTLEKYLDSDFEPIAGVTKKDIKEFVNAL